MGSDKFCKDQAELPKWDLIPENKSRSSNTASEYWVSMRPGLQLLTFSGDWHSQEPCTYNYHAKPHLHNPSDGNLDFISPPEHNLKKSFTAFLLNVH